MKASILPLILLPILHKAKAWGSLGHTTVAYIATNFVDSNTTKYFQRQLNDISDDYLASVATWADSYRYTAGGKFSEHFHFIDAEDSPPSSCGVVFQRDCGGNGCIVDAIGNYTLRLLNDSLPFYERMVAAKFIVHFLGDIHQPLHDENLLRGGNGIFVNFSGKPTNLHSTWDTAIPEHLMGSYSLPTAQNWSRILTTRIQSGIYAEESASWLKGMNLGDLNTIQDSALVWARESNTLVCTAVLPEGLTAVGGKELNGTYYENAVPVVERQIARAGYRLAAWMTLIAAKEKLELESVREAQVELK